MEAHPDVKFFKTVEQFNVLSADTIISMQKDYDVTIEEIDYSPLSGRYWTLLGEPISYGSPTIEYKTEHPNVVVFRPKNSSSSLELLTETILQCPFTRAVLYPNDDTKTLIGKYRNTEKFNRENDRRQKNTVITTTHHLTYVFPELSLLEKDYVRDLFHVVRDQVYQEQADIAAQMKLSRLRMPTNQVIGRFVTEMFLEEYNDKYYLTFVYEEREKVRNSDGLKEEKEKSEDRKNMNVPIELELLADLPLDDDDNLNDTDESGVIIDDESYVRYALVLNIFSSHDENSPIPDIIKIQ